MSEPPISDAPTYKTMISDGHSIFPVGTIEYQGNIWLVMDFEDFTMAEKQTALQQIKKLDEERTKLLESAKADALARAEEAIHELAALGFDYELVEPTRETAPRKTGTARKASAPDHHPKGTCPVCEYATKPPHDKRSHKSQQKKRPFTADELQQRSLVRV